MKRRIQALGACVMLLISGCGAVDSTFSCDRSATSQQSCTDYENYVGDAAVTKSDCTRNGGTANESLCSRTGVVGGCRVTSAATGGSVLTTWYYTGTASLIMKACSAVGGTFTQ